jgi:cysteine desulfurase
VSIRPIYLDNNATTPTDPRVIEAMNPWWFENCGNPHSGDHWFGWTANQAVEKARLQVASLIGGDENDILFTSGATEANNLSLLGAAGCRGEERRKVIVSAVEHKCVLESASALKRMGFSVDVAPVDSEGIIDLDVLSKLLDERTSIVSVMLVNNEIGSIQPIEEVSKLCASVGAWLHCDAAQAPAAVPFNVDDLGIDLLSLSAHKIYGPKGIGAMFARSDILARLQPQTFGGGQEKNVRSGTIPTPLVVGFGEAADIMGREFSGENQSLRQLTLALWEGICRLDNTTHLNGPPHRRHPGNLNIQFPGRDASALIGALQPNVAASTGSACTTGTPEPSHVLQAIGLSMTEAESSVRFGVGRFTTLEDIERALSYLDSALRNTAQAVA